MAAAPTRERLLREGLRLFAEHGFDGTSVGDIEAAAGLVPRRGALYRHFASKADLLAAALDAGSGHDGAAAAPDPDLTGYTLGQQALAEFDRQQAIIAILERDGARVPDVRERARSGSDATYARLEEAIAASAGPDVDATALAVLALGGLINVRRAAWTLGGAPLAVSDERMLAAFARVLAGDVPAAADAPATGGKSKRKKDAKVAKTKHEPKGTDAGRKGKDAGRKGKGKRSR